LSRVGSPRGAARRADADPRPGRHGRLGHPGPALANSAEPSSRRQDRDPSERRRCVADLAVRALLVHGVSLVRRGLGPARRRESGARDTVRGLERPRRGRGDTGPRADARPTRLRRLARPHRSMELRPAGVARGGRPGACVSPAVVARARRRHARRDPTAFRDGAVRVLHLSTYPVEVPRHGGQARVANIVRTYEAAGIATRVIAVYQSEIYWKGVVGAHDVAFPLDSPHREPGLPLCTDVASGDFAVKDPQAWGAIEQTIASFKPEVIQLEQPWLWPVVERLRADERSSPFR